LFARPKRPNAVLLNKQEKGTQFRDLWDELVAARFGDQDARGSYIFLHLLP
jgi:hypothetical protein